MSVARTIVSRLNESTEIRERNWQALLGPRWTQEGPFAEFGPDVIIEKEDCYAPHGFGPAFQENRNYHCVMDDDMGYDDNWTGVKSKDALLLVPNALAENTRAGDLTGLYEIVSNRFA